MKSIVFILVLICFAILPASSPIKDDCTCKGIKFYGKVKIVDNFEDFKIKVDDNFFHIRIEITRHPSRCGQWEFVDNFEDFKVRFVEHHEDFKIKFDNNFPGLR